MKFGPGTYSDNYDMSIYGNVAKDRDTATDYIESSTAEIAVLKDGALMSFDAGGGAERTLGWVSTSLIPSLLTAVSEGDDRKIRSIAYIHFQPDESNPWDVESDDFTCPLCEAKDSLFPVLTGDRDEGVYECQECRQLMGGGY